MFKTALLIWILFVTTLTNSKGQLIENFSNGNLTTSPIWVGDVGSFTILGSNILRSNASVAGSSAISTSFIGASTRGNEWNIQVGQNFASSSSNFSRIYLASDVSTLTGSLNGYYLQLGENLSADVVDLFKQTGNTRTSIMRGTTTIASAFAIDIKINCSQSGSWTLFVKSVTSVNFGSSEASYFDNTNSTFSYFGILATYTVTNRLNFQFDNITVTSLPDFTPPIVIGATTLGLNLLQVEFNEPIAQNTGTILGNYLLNNTLMPSSVSVVGANLINLTFANYTFAGTNILSVSGIADLALNVILPANATVNFNFSIPNAPYSFSLRDIVFNEFMADVNPVPLGIPAVEYIEIYNTTSQTINLQGVVLRDYASSGTFVNKTITGITTIAGNGFLVLCSNAAKTSLTGLNIPVYGFSTLDPSTEDNFELVDRSGNVIDKIEYFSSWYKNSSKSSGGWSIEQINPTTTCTGINNWVASTNVNGGTPGFQNSTYSLAVSQVKPSVSLFKTFNSTQLGIKFAAPILPFSSQLIASSTAFGINVVNSSSDSLTIQLSTPIDSGFVYTVRIQNVRNCVGTLLADTNLIFSNPNKAKTGDIIFSEIYADETPSNGLPEGEFIEIYNNTNKVLDLGLYKLWDALSGGTIPNGTTILPHSYLILSNTTNAQFYSLYGKTVGVPSFPSLNSTGDDMSIRTSGGQIIASVKYSNAWYGNPDKKDGGWSLEKIDLNSTCENGAFWSTSVDAKGGTPGQPNSISNLIPNPKKPFVAVNFVQNLSNLLLTFSEQVFPYSNLLAVTSSVLGVSAFQNATDSLKINFSTPIDSGIVYAVRLQNIQNCSGQVLLDTTILISLAKKLKTGDIVFSEIYADETPSNGMPEGEFIEIYNKSDKVIDLSLYKLWDASSAGTVPAGTTILPKSYLILSNSTNAQFYSLYGKTIGVPSFPTLNSTGDNISIRSPQGQLISRIKYSDTWYGNQNKQDGGWSLEKVDLNNPCETASNWTASTDSKGATPGKPNSVQTTNPDLSSANLTNAFAVSDSVLLLLFDDVLDSISTYNSKINLSNSLSHGLQKIDLQQITLKVIPKIIPKTFYIASVSGFKDCALNEQTNTQTKAFILPEKANENEVILNELLFNPRTGGADFVEIFNNSSKSINLKNWILANLDKNNNIINYKIIIADNELLEPFSYKVFTTDNLNIFNNYPNAKKETFIQMDGFPSYPDDEGTVLLMRADSVIIDQFFYKDDYHYKLLDDKEGTSLERIRFDLPTNEPSNWQSAAATVGYATPGFKNSQSASESAQNQSVISLDPPVFTPDEDGWRDFTLITCNLPSIGYTISLTVYDVDGRSIKTIATGILAAQNSVHKWDGLDDSGKRVPIGVYMLVLEGFTLDGQKITKRESVVVGSKF